MSAAGQAPHGPDSIGRSDNLGVRQMRKAEQIRVIEGLLNHLDIGTNVDVYHPCQQWVLTFPGPSWS